ncbi:MAG: hypothetical protein R3297_09370, partial [Desulfobulbales bacterium]|nr:hypothetical protein [Desulfobulbales bacterium]
MKKVSWLLFTVFLNGIILSFSAHNACSGEILGDINADSKLDLHEAVYALQVVAGLKPAILPGPDSGPHYSAWGEYTYAAATGNITLDFTFSNFAKKGPKPGDSISTSVQSVSPTEMLLSTGDGWQTWTRNSGESNDITGRWHHEDTANSVSETIVFYSDNNFLYSAYGDAYTEVVDVLQSTITIDGDFTDWSPAMRLNLYWSGG